MNKKRIVKIGIVLAVIYTVYKAAVSEPEACDAALFDSEKTCKNAV